MNRITRLGQRRNRAIAPLFAALALTYAASAHAENRFIGEARTQAFARVNQLKSIQSRHVDKILGLQGAHGFGIGFEEKRGFIFQVMVEPGTKVQSIPQTIEGIPVVVESRPRMIVENGGLGCVPCHANQLALPVNMGNSGFGGAFCSACTMGFKACDIARDQVVYVTNAHCSTNATGCEATAAFGSATYHTSPLDATPQCSLASVVGSVSQQTPISCVANNTVDAASIVSNSTQSNQSIRDIGVPSFAPGTAMVGDEVQKSGRTTGLTFGVVTSVSLTVGVNGYCCGAPVFTNQILIDATGADWSLGGDSGSAVLNMNQPPEIVGLHFAGAGTSGVANPIGTVLTTLSLSLNLLDCSEVCSFGRSARRSRQPESMLRLGYAFRDEVLSKTPRGRQYTDMFYRHTDALAEVMVTQPELTARSGALLDQLAPSIRRWIDTGEPGLPASDVNDLQRLLADYAAVTEDEALNAALVQLIVDLENPETWESLRADGRSGK